MDNNDNRIEMPGTVWAIFIVMALGVIGLLISVYK